MILLWCRRTHASAGDAAEVKGWGIITQHIPGGMNVAAVAVSGAKLKKKKKKKHPINYNMTQPRIERVMRWHGVGLTTIMARRPALSGLIIMSWRFIFLGRIPIAVQVRS
jgi:hypothetical protein